MQNVKKREIKSRIATAKISI